MIEDAAGHESDRREVLEMLAQFDAPAYARRARRVEQELEHLLERLRARRDEWLPMPRLRLGQLAALAGRWPALLPHLEPDGLAGLEHTHEWLRPTLRLPLAPSSSPRVLRGALCEYAASAGRFNRRWEAHLAGLDLAPLNAGRDGYNRYYLLEKECAVRNSTVARQGYQPLPPLTAADLLGRFPPLFVPRLRQGR